MRLLDSILHAFSGPGIADVKVDCAKLPAFRAEHFPDAGPKPWLDDDRWHQRLASLPSEHAELCRKWATDGYIVLPKLVPDALLDEAWLAYEEAVQRGKIILPGDLASDDDKLPGRCLNPHKRVSRFCKVAKHPDLMTWLKLLLGHPAKLLQTIASHKGSQQSAHSDSIHMTTYPLGYLAASWIAFEDIHPDSGPLEFYPGSHRLPYVFSHSLRIPEDGLKTDGYGPYRARYEPFVRKLVEEHGLKPKLFEARKGDALIWHANLLHGGSPRRNLQLTRKALVGHYFANRAFVYHDLSAKSSRQQYFDGCLVP